MSGLSRDSLWYRGCKWGGHICTRKEKSANEGNLFFHTLVVFVNDYSLLKKWIYHRFVLNVKKAARKIADLHTFMINTQSLQKFLNVATFSTLFFQIFQNAPQITQFFVILSPAHTESTEASHRSQSHGGLTQIPQISRIIFKNVQSVRFVR